MQVSKRTLASLALVAAMVAASALLYDRLPEQLATHWNADNAVDDTLPRALGLALFPALGLGLAGLFALVPRIDPLGENIAEFRTAYDVMAVTSVALLAYVQALVLWWNLGNEFAVSAAVAPAVAAVYVVSGYAVERAERNWFVGFRTPWTLSDERVWERTHRRGGRLLKVAGIVAAAGVLFPEYAIALLVAPILLVAAYTTVYSYVEYRRLDRANAG
ncbi:SdpI family protein [Halostella litorea]|uniref:SdpI family protein n=1 Tax=Halostella litorea TaxID=2528831 RepID=UPI001091CBFD|nr:SdpI family protein [Halostella litorea]